MLFGMMFESVSGHLEIIGTAGVSPTGTNHGVRWATNVFEITSGSVEIDGTCTPTGSHRCHGVSLTGGSFDLTGGSELSVFGNGGEGVFTDAEVTLDDNCLLVLNGLGHTASGYGVHSTGSISYSGEGGLATLEVVGINDGSGDDFHGVIMSNSATLTKMQLSDMIVTIDGTTAFPGGAGVRLADLDGIECFNSNVQIIGYASAGPGHQGVSFEMFGDVVGFGGTFEAYGEAVGGTGKDILLEQMAISSGTIVLDSPNSSGISSGITLNDATLRGDSVTVSGFAITGIAVSLENGSLISSCLVSVTGTVNLPHALILSFV